MKQRHCAISRRRQKPRTDPASAHLSNKLRVNLDVQTTRALANNTGVLVLLPHSCCGLRQHLLRAKTPDQYATASIFSRSR